MDGLIRLFVGRAPNGDDAESCAVLEYTARKNCSMPIEITWMEMTHDVGSPWHGWNTSTWATPFSGFRWAIPEVCGFKGQAIYMDSDMIIQADLAELWNAPWEQGKVIQMKGGWRTCVAKWNCERAKTFLLPLERLKLLPNSHQRMFTTLQSRPELVQVFDRQWNNFDGENDDLKDVKILHYTDMSTQPHLKYAIPRMKASGLTHWYDGEVRDHRRKDVVELFERVFKESQEAGYLVEKYCPSTPYGNIIKESQKHYRAANGFDVTAGE